MVALLSILSASAAAGMRIALPLLIIGFLQSERLWSDVPILASIEPPVVISILTSWSLFELIGSKKLLGQRVLQVVQLLCSPVVGSIISIAVAKLTHVEIGPIWLIGLVGGLFAFLLQLVLVGWFFRLRGLPIWVVLIEDTLCIFLVLFAFNAPQEGGLIAMLLLWLAVRSSQHWQQWYRESRRLALKPSGLNYD
ncbi:DUF4126 domain-containing protein [Oscillatoria salina]|uniref:DUF4126 domain-containing protein n=1 Tax=Oscillatoria salina TaxID=331517 RepID=UPI001CCDC42B|nr:DUF4126 domain-containing protein [Oscillatoria salina]